MSPSLPRRARRRQETIDEVLDAARSMTRDDGLGSLSMRDLGARVGLHATSLYQYFPSKLDIYDALFALFHRELQDWMAGRTPMDDPLEDFRSGSRRFTEFCIADATRYELMFQRTVPGFVPSLESMRLAEQSYAPMAAALAALGITEQADIDLWVVVQMGLTDQQLGNDPGGRRFVDLLDAAIDMYVASRPTRHRTTHRRIT
jgi:AcrR family transcriptional regulator